LKVADSTTIVTMQHDLNCQTKMFYENHLKLELSLAVTNALLTHPFQ